MPLPKLQFAFQGGGAKFIGMLPVAHAISDMARENRFVLSAIAGTSAGSICAALIAADCDFDALIAYLRRSGNDHIQSLRAPMPDLRGLQAFLDDVKAHADRIRFYNPASWGKLVGWRRDFARFEPFLKRVVLDGQSALLSDELETFIGTLFSFCRKPVRTGPFSLIESYQQPKLFITLTDIVSNEGVTAEGNLLRAVVDSCSIPIALRSFDYLPKSNFVDGGLCNNLPANYLLADPTVPAFLVYPVEREEIARPDMSNFFSYFLNVIFCPIDHNMKRSKELVEESFHIKLDVGFSTFDFDAAMDFLKDIEACDAVYENTSSRLNDFLNTYGSTVNQSQVRVTDTRTVSDYVAALETLTDSFESHLTVRKCTLIVRVNEHGSARGSLRSADTVTMKTEFEVKSKDFRVYRSNLRRDKDGRMVPSIWYANNITRNCRIPIRVLSLSQQTLPGFQKCLVEFLEPEKHVAVSDTLELLNVSYRKGDMAEMNEGRSEFIAVTNPHSAMFEVAELICKYPRSLGDFRMMVDDQKSSIKAAEARQIENGAAVFDHEIETIGVQGFHLPPGGKFFARIVRMGDP